MPGYGRFMRGIDEDRRVGTQNHRTGLPGRRGDCRHRWRVPEIPVGLPEEHRRHGRGLCRRPAGGRSLQSWPRLHECRQVQRRHRRIRRGRPPASLFGGSAEGPGDVGLRELPPRRLRQRDRHRQALRHALSGQPRRRLCAVHHGPVLFRPGQGRHARPGDDPAGARRHADHRRSLP